jgi:hypothetical protein
MACVRAQPVSAAPQLQPAGHRSETAVSGLCEDVIKILVGHRHLNKALGRSSVHTEQLSSWKHDLRHFVKRLVAW